MADTPLTLLPSHPMGTEALSTRRSSEPAVFDEMPSTRLTAHPSIMLFSSPTLDDPL